jgi:Domain of unknown function (DUF397)
MWRKSSKSNTGSQCVEVRHDLTALRDSKSPEAVMPVSRRALAQLTAFTQVRR